MLYVQGIACSWVRSISNFLNAVYKFKTISYKGKVCLVITIDRVRSLLRANPCTTKYLVVDVKLGKITYLLILRRVTEIHLHKVMSNPLYIYRPYKTKSYSNYDWYYY